MFSLLPSFRLMLEESMAESDAKHLLNAGDSKNENPEEKSREQRRRERYLNFLFRPLYFGQYNWILFLLLSFLKTETQLHLKKNMIIYINIYCTNEYNLKWYCINKFFIVSRWCSNDITVVLDALSNEPKYPYIGIYK